MWPAAFCWKRLHLYTYCSKVTLSILFGINGAFTGGRVTQCVCSNAFHNITDPGKGFNWSGYWTVFHSVQSQSILNEPEPREVGVLFASVLSLHRWLQRGAMLADGSFQKRFCGDFSILNKLLKCRIFFQYYAITFLNYFLQFFTEWTPSILYNMLYFFSLFFLLALSGLFFTNLFLTWKKLKGYTSFCFDVMLWCFNQLYGLNVYVEMEWQLTPNREFMKPHSSI